MSGRKGRLCLCHLGRENRGRASASCLSSTRNYHRGRNGHLIGYAIGSDGGDGDSSMYLWDPGLNQVLPWLCDCKCTRILQDHGSRVEILSQGFLPFPHLAPFKGIPRGGCCELGISRIDWGHKTWGYWILIISRGNVAHRCEMGSRLWAKEPTKAG